MTDTSSTTTTAVKAASKKAADTIAENLPTVVETTEVALEIPAKVVVNKSVLVVAGMVIGTAAGVAGYWGWQKIQAKRAANKVEVPDDASSLTDVEKN